MQRYPFAAAALIAVASFSSRAADDTAASAPDVPASIADDKAGANATQLPPVLVEEKPWRYNAATRYAHLLPEVDGAQVTVTKKTTVEKLDEQPTVIDNNQRELFSRLPGVLVSEQQNPDQLNLSYRGIGNPQESEYVLVLQDGIPLQSDWIGFPTLYYIPVPQTLDSVQLIRGGSGLLYGPEPQPVINFVSRRPDADHVLSGYTEQVGGADALYSTFTQLSGTRGNAEYLADYHHRQSDGRRANGDYGINSGDLHFGYRLSDAHKLAFDFHAYTIDSGDAGRLSYTQFQANPDQTTTPINHTWLDRYTGVATYEGKFNARGLLVTKFWGGYEDLDQRTTPNVTPAQPQPSTSTLSIERFYYTGLDSRFRQGWGSGNAFTIGVTGYLSRAPWHRYVNNAPANLAVGRDDRSGTENLDQSRRTRYGAVFAENVFRFGRFHVVPSVRYEHEELVIDEHVVPSNRPLVDRTFGKSLPLFGLGLGNDFGRGNETYASISQGFRPLRYLDVASPFGNTATGNNNPDPTKSLSYEAGVHGWPAKGLYYDVSLFQVNVTQRIESQPLLSTPDPTDTVNVNTGDTRSRGLEAQLVCDLLRLFPDVAETQHLELSTNLSLLDAEFTKSANNALNHNTPAFAPRYLVRGSLIWRQDKRFKLALSAQTVASSYFRDANTAQGAPGAANYLPARVPQYTVFDFSGDYIVVPHVRVLGGVANLGDRTYYSRVFQNTLEPASRRTFYAGAAFDF